MPFTRCLSCKRLIPSTMSRCDDCAAGVKAERNRQGRELGPCPQDGTCCYCHEPARPPRNPFVWCHHPVRFIDGGRTVKPGHKACNEGPAKRH